LLVVLLFAGDLDELRDKLLLSEMLEFFIDLESFVSDSSKGDDSILGPVAQELIACVIFVCKCEGTDRFVFLPLSLAVFLEEVFDRVFAVDADRCQVLPDSYLFGLLIICSLNVTSFLEVTCLQV